MFLDRFFPLSFLLTVSKLLFDKTSYGGFSGRTTQRAFPHTYTSRQTPPTGQSVLIRKVSVCWEQHLIPQAGPSRSCLNESNAQTSLIKHGFGKSPVFSVRRVLTAVKAPSVNEVHSSISAFVVKSWIQMGSLIQSNCLQRSFPLLPEVIPGSVTRTAPFPNYICLSWDFSSNLKRPLPHMREK